MKTLLKLKRELDHALTSLEKMYELAEKEDRTLTEDEETRETELLAEVETLESKIENEEARSEKRASVREKLDARDEPISKSLKADNEPEKREVKIEFPRTAKLRAFLGENAHERAYRSGMWLLGNCLGNEKALRYCKEHGVSTRALSGDVNSKGGALVPEEFNSAIIDLREMYGVFRQNTSVMPMASDTLVMSRRTGGVTAYFVSDNDTITDSDTAWDNVQLTAKKLATLTKISSELTEDAAISVADWVANEIAWAFAKKEDECGFMGDGTSTYGGIQGVLTKIEANTTFASYVNATSGTDTFAEIDAEDLGNVMGKLPQYARPMAKWYCSQEAFDTVFSRLAVSGGGNTVDSVTGAYRPAYLGYPIVVSQVFPTSSLNNQVMLLFGALNLASTMGDRRDVRIATSADRYFDADQVAVRGTQRFDINVHDIGDATTAGPVTALIGNT